MDQENSFNWLIAAVIEHSCKKNLGDVIKKILSDEELCSKFCGSFGMVFSKEKKIKQVFIFIQMLRMLQSSVETFAVNLPSNCPWKSDFLSKIIESLESTYEQCEFISLKKFFSLLSQLKFLDLMHLLRSNVESTALLQQLNLHFPRLNSSQKESLKQRYSINNPKILAKVEESCAQCRRLILKLATDASYRSVYMNEQFSNDMKKMVNESVIHLKEVIDNLLSNAGLTVIEKAFSEEISATSDDLGFQLLLEYLQPEISSEALIRFLNEMEHALEPPSGGFSSCLPFDTLSECSETMYSYSDDSEGDSEDNCDEKEKT